MKVKNRNIVYPILIAIVFIVIVIILLTKLNVANTNQGYQYKEKLFQASKLNTIEIQVADEDWQEVLDNPTAEEYVEATVLVNGEQFEHVGVRAKGNSSLSSVASSDSDRYSLKIDFGQYNSVQTYYGLEKINLNNGFSDSTLIREYVSYALLKQYGVVTPAFTFTKVMLNDSYYGLMLAVEEPGEAYVKTNYNTSSGFLFKPENTGSDLKYISDNIEDYSGILNEVKYSGGIVKNDSNLVQMIEEINNNDYSSLDVEAVVKYFALNTALVNMDSYQGNFNHNYYLYENENGKFSILPWDYNMSFGGFGGGGLGGGFGNGGFRGNNEQGSPTNTQNQQRPARQNSSNNASDSNNQGNQADSSNVLPQGGGNRLNMMGDGELLSESNLNLSIYSPVSGSIANKPLLNVILQNEETLQLYETYMEEIATTLLTEANVKAIVEPLESLLYEAVNEDTTKFSTTEQFIEGIRGEQSIVNFAVARSKAILEQLKDETAKTVLQSSTTENNGASNMPNVGEGQMPNFGGGEGQVPPGFTDGEQPNFENMPNVGEGQMPNFGGGQRPNVEGRQMPNFANGQAPPGFMNQQQETTTADYSIKQLFTILGLCLVAVFVALVMIRFISQRKYKKGGL